MSSRRPIRVSPLWVLFLLGLVMARGGTPAAQAQAGHVHQWTEGSPPDAVWGAFHIGGQPVNTANPALPCEVLELRREYTPPETDVCTATGCSFPSGTAGDPDVKAVRWRRLTDSGRFVQQFIPGHWENSDVPDPDEQGAYVTSGDTVYYRVRRDVPTPETFLVRPQFDDYGVNFDDDPRWDEVQGYPIDGTRCWVKDKRDVAPWQLSACGEGTAQPGHSTVTPLNGNVSFTAPVTSWGYGGETIDFALTYNSRSVVDANARANQIPHPAALSDQEPRLNYNPKWTHTFAQWVEVVSDGHAVWNRGDGTQMAFRQTWPGGTTGPVWESYDSSHHLESTGTLISPTFLVEDDPTWAATPYEKFTLTDGAGTEYRFEQARWNISEIPPNGICYAIPYFLLTQIRDRWGRTLSVTWNAHGVASVTDGAGRGLTFAYTNGLVSGITDPAGRTHTLTHSLVGGQLRPTRITVLGAGSPRRATYKWDFVWGGPFQDVITAKTEPSGKTVQYEFEAVDPDRELNADWDGRMTRSFFYDDLDATPGFREIVRNGHHLVYPGGDSYTYAYSGHHLTSITHDGTGEAVHYTWDARHNLLSFRTNLEASYNPLTRMEYDYVPSAGADVRIGAAAAIDVLGRRAEADFNVLGLPTETRLVGTTLPTQVTQFTYDHGLGLTKGNLTQVTAAAGTLLEESADLLYNAPTRPALPTAVTDAVGRTSTATYHVDGSPFQTSSPPNPMALPGSADLNASTSTLELNADELPWRTTDPMGHQTEVTYNAEAVGSNRLVVTYKNLADNSTRTVTLDGAGRAVKSTDERGVRTETTYNVAGQPVEVRTIYANTVLRQVRYYYNAQGDLAAFDPPAGSGSRVTFEYERYSQWYGMGAPVKDDPPVYQGQVTRIHYPDGTSEYFGYNGAGELAWRYGPDGRTTALQRDSLHRVYRVDYPAAPGYPAFSVETQFDEFGRPAQVTDANGTSTFAYDALNRPTSVTPAVGLGASYGYVKDTVLGRRITQVTLSGVGTWQYGEDGKGRTAEVLNPFNQLSTLYYDPDGKPVREVRANGTYTDYTYTARDWPAAIQHFRANGQPLDTFQYFYTSSAGVYDPTGHLRREVDGAGQTRELFYDNLYQLTRENHPDLASIHHYYDGNGNRTRMIRGNINYYFGYDAQNKLLWQNRRTLAPPTTGQTEPYRLYTYDAAGQPTAVEHRDAVGGPVLQDTLAWDGTGKLRNHEVRNGGLLLSAYTAAYDGDGDRVAAVLNGVPHTYSYGAGLLHDSAGSTVYTPSVSQRKNGVDSFFHSDWLGSTRYLTDAGGLTAQSAYRFDAYGNGTAAAGPDLTSFKFAGAEGYESDAPGGLLLLGARYYDPFAARFLNPDPIGFAGGLNLYGYCDNDPVGLVDPSGLDPKQDRAWRNFTGNAGTLYNGARGFLWHRVVRPLFVNVKMRDDAVGFRNANPDNPVALKLRQHGHQVSDALDEFGVDITNNLALGSLQIANAARTSCNAGGAAKALTAGSRMPRHHVFPRKYRAWFSQRGINIDEFTLELQPHEHKFVHAKAGVRGGAWNKAWDDFIRTNPTATAEEVYRHAGVLIHRFGIDGRPLLHY